MGRADESGAFVIFMFHSCHDDIAISFLSFFFHLELFFFHHSVRAYFSRRNSRKKNAQVLSGLPVLSLLPPPQKNLKVRREMGESARRNQKFKPNLEEKARKCLEKNDASPPKNGYNVMPI